MLSRQPHYNKHLEPCCKGKLKNQKSFSQFTSSACANRDSFGKEIFSFFFYSFHWLYLILPQCNDLILQNFLFSNKKCLFKAYMYYCLVPLSCIYFKCMPKNCTNQTVVWIFITINMLRAYISSMSSILICATVFPKSDAFSIVWIFLLDIHVKEIV